MQNVQSDFSDLPEDYSECGTCGFDHCYEPEKAAKAHPPDPRFEGIKRFSDDDSCSYVFQAFNREAAEKFLGETITPENAEDMAERLTGWHDSYRGPGRSFSDSPSLRLYKRSVLVTQRRGLDI